MCKHVYVYNKKVVDTCTFSISFLFLYVRLLPYPYMLLLQFVYLRIMLVITHAQERCHALGICLQHDVCHPRTTLKAFSTGTGISACHVYDTVVTYGSSTLPYIGLLPV